MPRIQIGQAQSAGILQETIANRIKTGKVVPIISHVISSDLVLGQGQYQNMVEAYGRHVQYNPEAVAGRLNLPQISQYVSVMRQLVADREGAKEYYLDFIKSWLFDLAESRGLPPATRAELNDQFDALPFSRLAQGLGYPHFEQGSNDPLLTLAAFPLPIYLTTCQHYFIEMALRRAGKNPRSAVCAWREGLDPTPFYVDETGKLQFDAAFHPTPAQPLVYHLHGFDEFAPSLVLTEDDYLEFLVAIARDKGRNTDPVPMFIREALVESSLLLLGFQLRFWDFRVLFWGLIKSDFKRRYKSVSVQLDPNEVDRKYLESYLNEADFDIYWGNIFEYTRELRQNLEGDSDDGQL